MDELPGDGKALGAWLRELREAAKLTQPQAGEAVGVPGREIRRWENSGTVPGGLMLLKLLQAYGVRFDPPPPGGAPSAVNVELQQLREIIASTKEETFQHLSDMVAKLARLEAAGEDALPAAPEEPPPSTPAPPRER